MARERNTTPSENGRRERGVSRGEGIRRRLAAAPEIDLSEEELRALADEGIDPDEVRRIARERHDSDEASMHDRDTARDALEGLTFEAEDDA